LLPPQPRSPDPGMARECRNDLRFRKNLKTK
jgi:hypothetical protein